MVTYHPYDCDITQRQVHSLAKGGAIAFSHKQLGKGSQKVFLTSHQAGRLNKGKGIRLRFSGSQIKHHIKHGGGFWGSVGSWLKGLTKKALNKGLEYAPQAAEALSTAAKGALGSVPYVGNELGNLAEQGIKAGTEKAAKFAKDKVDGWGLKKRGKGVARTRKMKLADLPRGGGVTLPGGGLKLPGGGLLPPPIRGVNSNSAGI